MQGSSPSKLAAKLGIKGKRDTPPPASPALLRSIERAQVQHTSTKQRQIDPEFGEAFTFAVAPGLPDPCYVLHLVAEDADLEHRAASTGARFLGEVAVGLGRIVALYHRSSNLYHIYDDNRCLYL